MTREILEILQVKDLPVIGLLLATIFVIGWFYHRALKIIDRLRNELENERREHIKDIQAINDAHAKKIEELNEKLILEIRKQGKAYEHVGTALEMIMKSQGK